MQIEKHDRWKVVSHLQKCIRRGWSSNIASAASALWNIDNAYLRYRLAVIAMEDIGIANIEAVSELMEDKINKRWVMANGGIDGLLLRIQGLANGCKDRTPCTWGSLASKKDFEAKHGDWSLTGEQKAIDIAWDSTQSMSIRAAAVFRVIGTDLFPHPHFPIVTGKWDLWVEANAQYCPPSIEALMRLGQKTQKEWHPAFLGLCWHNHAQSSGNTIETQPRDFGDVHGYCSASIDAHTAEGRRAIAQWWRTTPQLREEWLALGWEKSDNDAVTALSSMVFLLEGGAVDKRLHYPLALEAEKLNKDRWSARNSLPGKNAACSVWKHMPQLHALRLSNVAQRPSPEESLRDNISY